MFIRLQMKGEESMKMIKVVYCMRRKIGIGREAFLAHWAQVHAPVVLANRELLRLAHYSRSWPEVHGHSARVERGGQMLEPFDGVAQLWWSSQEDMDHAFSDPRALEIQRWLARDEANFVDPARSSRWIGGEDLHF
jgi:uncharacterized protein (TIGR02118 family)